MENLETRLAYFLIREMLPPEILEGEGFKVKSLKSPSHLQFMFALVCFLRLVKP